MMIMRFAICMAFLAILPPPPAHAYLDPGTGSYVVQIVIAFIVGSGFAVKMGWHRIKGFFGRLFSRPSKDDHRQP